MTSTATTTETKTQSRVPMFYYYPEPMPRKLSQSIMSEKAEKAKNKPEEGKENSDSPKKKKKDTPSYRSLLKQKDVNRYVAVACKTEGDKLLYGAAIWRRTDKDGYCDPSATYHKHDLKQTAEQRLKKHPVEVTLTDEQKNMSHNDRCVFVRRLVHKMGVRYHEAQAEPKVDEPKEDEPKEAEPKEEDKSSNSVSK